MTQLISYPVTQLNGTAVVPGDKSISHRSLMISSQLTGTTHITGLLEGEDVLNTAAALRAMGVTVEQHAKGSWSVQGVGVGGLQASKSVLDMGNSGTSTRLLMGLLVVGVLFVLYVLYQFASTA